VAGERGVDGDFGGFRVADFSDHNDVGVLPQVSAQTNRKRVADFWVDLALINAVHPIFDRIFNGDDVDFGTIKHV